MIREHNRYLIILICLFCIYLINFLVYKVNINPLEQHLYVFKTADKQYIRTEQSNEYNDSDTIFLEKDQIRFHREVHKNLDEIFSCERAGNSKCYVSVLSFNINETNPFFQANLLNGVMPSHDQVLINENLAKHLNLKIGDLITYKNSFYNYNLEISGIISNFYGFPDYNFDSSYYCCVNLGEKYSEHINGTFYNFSNNSKDAFHSESIRDYIKELSKKIFYRYLFLILFSSIFICGCFFFIKKIQFLRKHYRYLYKLGNNVSFIKKKMCKDFFTSVLYSIIMNILILSIGCIRILLINMFISFVCIILVYLPEVFQYENIRN